MGSSSNLIAQEVILDSTIVYSAIDSTAEKKKNSENKSKSIQPKKGFRAMYLGVLGGAGYYDVFFDPSYGTIGDISPVFGLSFRYESPVNKSIEFELRYRSSGWKSEDLYVRNLGIIEIPIIAHVSFGKKKLRPFFTLGETVTFIISQNEEILDPASEPVFANSPVHNKVGFALNLGLGVIRYFKKSAIQFEIRGTLALTNLYKPGNDLLVVNSNSFFAEGVIKYSFRVN